MLLEEIVEEKKKEIENTLEGEEEENKEDIEEIEMFMKDWENEFENLNPNPEENSDFDSDNEINPLDTLTATGKYKSSKE